jgi:formate dehydrogenase maturation protein FdhE
MLSRSAADQFAPVLRLHESVHRSARAVVSVDDARGRLEAGRAAFDAVKLLARSRTIATHFDRGVDALETSGLASTSVASAVRQAAFDPRTLAVAWAGGDAAPSSAAQRVARRAAATVASAVLRKNAERVERAGLVAAWMGAACPCCGSAPDLAYGSPQVRMLVCSRCDARWTARGRGCLTCDPLTASSVARVRTPYLGYDLVICHTCGRYLKERAGHLLYHPLVERALTTEMDAAAERRGLRL